MAKLSVCIEMFWRELPYAERIRRTAAIGFEACEFWGWRNKDGQSIKRALSETGLALAAMSFEPSMTLIRRNAGMELETGMRGTAAFAAAVGCKTLIVTVGNTIDDETYEESRRRVVRNLSAIGRIADDHGLTIVLEPLNTLANHHGYWLTKMAQAADIVDEVDLPSVKILMDLYHQQITEGNLIENLRVHASRIGHFHTAGVPGRHELVGGELDYAALFRAIDDTGYDGYVGLEYSPIIDAGQSLRQALSLV